MNGEQDIANPDAGEIPADPEGAGVIDLTDEAQLALLSRGIEALVMVSADPIPDAILAQSLGSDEVTVRTICVALADSYEDQGRGFQLAYVAGGWRFQSHPDMSDLITGHVLEGQSSRLSPAAMETLAIIAYKQPVSRAQIGAIRGVNVDGVLRTLSQRGYIAEIGRDTGPGQAVLFGTTQLFCEQMGIPSPRDLPPLGDFVPPAHVVEALELTLMADPGARRGHLDPDDEGAPETTDPPADDAVADPATGLNV